MSSVLDVVPRSVVLCNATAFVNLGLFSISGGREWVGKGPILIHIFEKN